jgi:HAD superfamily hydrolase (TIGR01458 family)
MPDLPSSPKALLLDIDGVLHVGREPVKGAVAALEALREKVGGIRLVTNTTSRSRADVTEGLRESGFELGDEEVLTPAALALAYCQERGLRRVELLVSDALRPDLEGLQEAGTGEEADAVLLGDLGDRLDAEALNRAFRRLMGGAELLALGHNRYWRREDGLALDVGAYSAALEYGAQVEARVLGKPSGDFFASALRQLGGEPGEAVMVGDDIEADVGGGLRAGIASVLVRTGKFEARDVASSGIEPTAVIDSIADLPRLLDRAANG